MRRAIVQSRSRSSSKSQPAANSALRSMKLDLRAGPWWQVIVHGDLFAIGRCKIAANPAMLGITWDPSTSGHPRHACLSTYFNRDAAFHRSGGV